MSALLHPDLKVEEILTRHPATLAVFVAHGFKPLQNPFLRRAFAHLITVRGAAKMHSWDDDHLASFMAELQAASGTEAPPLPEEAAPLFDLADAAAMQAARITVGPDRIEVDNRGLEPPQPMVRVLALALQLAPGQRLVAHNDRAPAMLYPKLAELGYHHQTEPQPDGSYRITVSREALG